MSAGVFPRILLNAQLYCGLPRERWGFPWVFRSDLTASRVCPVSAGVFLPPTTTGARALGFAP